MYKMAWKQELWKYLNQIEEEVGKEIVWQEAKSFKI